MSIVVNIEAEVAWRTVKSDSNKRWIAVCDMLNLASEADTLDGLHSVIGETMDLLMLDLLEDNELEQFLLDHGWSPVQEIPNNSSDVRFHVPWELVVEGQQYDFERSAC